MVEEDVESCVDRALTKMCSTSILTGCCVDVEEVPDRKACRVSSCGQIGCVEPAAHYAYVSFAAHIVGVVWNYCSWASTFCWSMIQFFKFSSSPRDCRSQIKGVKGAAGSYKAHCAVDKDAL